MVSQQQQEEATVCGIQSLSNDPRAVGARYDLALNLVLVELNTGYTVAFPPARSQTLASAALRSYRAIAKGRFGNDRWEAAWRVAHPLEERPYRVLERPSTKRPEVDVRL